MASDKLTILRSERASPIFYVSSSNLVTVQRTQGRPIKVYQQAFGFTERGLFDLEGYGRHIDKYGYGLPADKTSQVQPNRKAREAGIEIRLAEDLFQNGASGFYDIFDRAGVDSGNSYDVKSMKHMRAITRRQVDNWLEKKVYGFEKSNGTFGRNLINLTKAVIPNPDDYFGVRVLTKGKAKRMKFSEIDYDNALEQGVSISIDWVIANKVLALCLSNALLRGTVSHQ
ncbi:MAG: hypothetical protein ACI8Y7_000134 [Candidatus Woesearchaeota archaeon]|jgi:hypothetical protein